MYEDALSLEPGPKAPLGLKPVIRISAYRTSATAVHHSDCEPILCARCGLEVPHAFQAPHLAGACPGYVLPCPHQPVGCRWEGPRSELRDHLEGCGFERMREDIYAVGSLNGSDGRLLRGVEELLAEGAAATVRQVTEAAEGLYTSALLPRHVKTLRGHKQPITCMTGLINERRLASADGSGIIRL